MTDRPGAIYPGFIVHVFIDDRIGTIQFPAKWPAVRSHKENGAYILFGLVTDQTRFSVAIDRASPPATPLFTACLRACSSSSTVSGKQNSVQFACMTRSLVFFWTAVFFSAMIAFACHSL
jgi:hypothetical protein